ncbi:hypothetical protein [Kribbella sindirgiensis]|uniref:Lipoate--protein ligase family protein n=1 Tax=Kribbella sindirgiensis TaxID=1124744 RepID=A0A4V6N3U6_9ACTN|nr:hypothetical protein [Kribbella sindirgiensis]TCC16737.1 hypothetical protein E0H50_40280 [Kribbella sindirgiensis]
MQSHQLLIGDDASQRRSALVELLTPAVVLRSELAAGTTDLVHVYQAQNPTVAFSARDLRSPSIAEAAQIARDAGFTCVVRSPGGRMVAYDSGAVVIDHITATLRGGPSVFASNAAHHLQVLRSLSGADLRIGEVDNEYCPGEFSINVAGSAKVLGSAQRITAGAALFSTVIQVVVPDRVRQVLIGVSDALGYPLRVSSIAGLADFAPAVNPSAVVDEFRADYRTRLGLEDGRLPDGLRALIASVDGEQYDGIFHVDDWARARPLLGPTARHVT